MVLTSRSDQLYNLGVLAIGVVDILAHLSPVRRERPPWTSRTNGEDLIICYIRGFSVRVLLAFVPPAKQNDD